MKPFTCNPGPDPYTEKAHAEAKKGPLSPHTKKLLISAHARMNDPRLLACEFSHASGGGVSLPDQPEWYRDRVNDYLYALAHWGGRLPELYALTSFPRRESWGVNARVNCVYTPGGFIYDGTEGAASYRRARDLTLELVSRESHLGVLGYALFDDFLRRWRYFDGEEVPVVTEEPPGDSVARRLRFGLHLSPDDGAK